MLLFLSSTFSDLRDERAALLQLSAPDRVLYGMEFFPAQPETPLAVALSQLDKADAMILVIGGNVGSLLPGRKDLTYTAAEFEHGQKRGLPIFAFVRTMHGKPYEDELDECKLKLLREFLATVKSSESTIKYYENCDQLQLFVTESIAAWEEKGRPGARKTFCTVEEFFSNVNPILAHSQSIRGRVEELKSLHAFAEGSEAIAILSGRGGIGKSKLLYDWVAKLKSREVLFIREEALWHAESVRELPTDQPILIIADDAHRTAQLSRLSLMIRELSADRNIKLLLSTRPGGLAEVSSCISRHFEPSEYKVLPELRKLGEAEVRTLATDLLGPEYSQFVPSLVRASKDAPIVTVVGAHTIRKGHVTAELLANESEFRSIVFDRFVDEFTAFATRKDFNYRGLLHVIAALGPVAISYEPTLSSVACFLTVRADEVAFAVSELQRSGLLIKTGSKYRIAPDVVADYLLEQRCVGADGRSTGFSHALFSAFRRTHLSELLRNLAELDWRISHSTSSAESLLDRVWQEIHEAFAVGNIDDQVQILKSVHAASGYQPSQTLQLVRAAMAAANQQVLPKSNEEDWYKPTSADVLRKLPRLLANIAYHEAHTQEAFERLWMLTQNDDRPRNQYPEGAARIMEDLVTCDLYTHISMLLKLAEITEQIAVTPGSFDTGFTPLDVVDKLLDKEGEHRETEGLTMHLGSFALPYERVQKVRKKALQIVERSLNSERPKEAVRAVRSIANALHPHLPSYGRTRTPYEKKWQDEERNSVLDIVARRLKEPTATPLLREIYWSLWQFLAWQVENNDKASKLLSSIDMSGDLLIFHMFCVDSYEYDRRIDKENFRAAQERWSVLLAQAVSTFRTKASTPPSKLSRVESIVAEAKTFNIQLKGFRSFLAELAKDDCFSSFVYESVRFPQECSDTLANASAAVVAHFRSTADPRYRSIVIEVACRGGAWLRAISSGVWGFEELVLGDIELITIQIKSDDFEMRKRGLLNLGFLGQNELHKEKALELLLSVDIGDNEELADEMCEALHSQRIGRDNMSESTVQNVLRKLVPVKRLEKYWLGQFLTWCSTKFPSSTVDFLLARLHEGVRRRKLKDWSYDVVPSDYAPVHFHSISQSPLYLDVLRSVRDFLLEGENFEREASKLFWSIGTLDDTTLSVLDEWIHSSHLEGVVDLLHEAISDIAFSRPYFANHVLESCAAMTSELLNRASGAFAFNVMPRSWGGSPGSAPPIFIAINEQATLAARDNPHLPLLKDVYLRIASSSDSEIKSSLAYDEELLSSYE